MEIVSTTYHDTLANQASEGWISQTIIDQAVRRVLTIKFRLGPFDRAASAADVCILALGEPRASSGENASRAQLGLTDRQQHLLEAVAKTGKPIVVVLFCGRPLQLRAVLEKADSLLVAWHPGIQAGNAISRSPVRRCGSRRAAHDVLAPRCGQLPLYYNRYRTGKPG